MRTQWLQVLSDVAGGGKSYSFPGRSFSRADLPDIRNTLSELRTAIEFTSGDGKQVVQALINTHSNFDPWQFYPW